MPELDLEPHEYQRHQREKQPVFLPGGKAVVLYVVGLFLFALILGQIAHPIVGSLLDLVWPAG